MSFANFIIGAVQAQANTSGLGTSGMVLVYIGAAVLFGLIGLVPLLSKEPTAKQPEPPAPNWTVFDALHKDIPVAGKLEDAGLTIDGNFSEVRELPPMSGRWGR
jgi:hypothetical protein